MENYQFSDPELEYLQKWFEQEEIDQAERVVYSYEDWLDPNRSMGFFIDGKADISAHYLTEDGNSTKKGNGQLTVFILPESEGLKIEGRKKEILEGFVTAYTEALIACFESRYEGWKKGEALISEEIALLDKLLFQCKESVEYAPRCVGNWLRFYTDSRQVGGTLYEWYYLIYQSKIDDALLGIQNDHADIPAHELNSKYRELHFRVAAKAFDRFYEYLNAKLAEGKAVPLTEKILTEKDCFIYETQLPGNPPSERYLSESKALDERIAAERQAGKLPVLANCPDCEGVIRGALKIGLTESDLRVFIEKFGRHEYDNFAAGPHFDKEKDRLNTVTLLDEIFEIASIFENPDLGDYFLKSAHADVQKRGLINWPSQAKVFNKDFKERLAQRNTAIAQPKSKAGRKPNPPRTFLSLFKGEPEMKRLLHAAAAVGLIANDGELYVWIDEGAKSHRVCALWFAAVHIGLTSDRFKNKEAITKVIQQFFRMESLSKDTIGEVNPHNDEYKKIKAALEKKLKE